jgi:hypothetical protein
MRGVTSFLNRIRAAFVAGAPRFLALGLGTRRDFPALQMMQQRGRDVGRAEAFFEQAFQELILPFKGAAL